MRGKGLRSFLAHRIETRKNSYQYHQIRYASEQKNCRPIYFYIQQTHTHTLTHIYRISAFLYNYSYVVLFNLSAKGLPPNVCFVVFVCEGGGKKEVKWLDFELNIRSLGDFLFVRCFTSKLFAYKFTLDVFHIYDFGQYSFLIHFGRTSVLIFLYFFIIISLLFNYTQFM